VVGASDGSVPEGGGAFGDADGEGESEPLGVEGESEPLGVEEASPTLAACTLLLPPQAVAVVTRATAATTSRDRFWTCIGPFLLGAAH